MTPTTSGFATISSLLFFFCSSNRILKYVSRGAFSGKGKRKGLQLVRGSEELADAMAALNSSFTASETALLSGKLFACAMYGEKDGSRDINQVRYSLFCDPQKAREPRQLPPSEDALLQHTKRANYQAAIWKSALTAAPDLPSPAGHG